MPGEIIDSIMKNHNLTESENIILKFDVEGSEYDAILNSSNYSIKF